MGISGEIVSVEVFAAKDSAGAITGVMMTAPCRCGLNQADALRIDGLTVLAMRERSILPIDLANLTERSRSTLSALAKSGRRLAVGEFIALGLLDAYFLDLIVVEDGRNKIGAKHRMDT